MGDDDGGTNAVKQSSEPVASSCCEAARSAGNGPNGAMNASSAVASRIEKELDVGGSGRRREEHFLAFLVGEGRSHWSNDIGLIGRAAVPGPVNDQDGVARFDETLRPAGSAVGCVQPFGALQSTAMYQDNRGGTDRTLCRCFPGHVHRPCW